MPTSFQNVIAPGINAGWEATFQKHHLIPNSQEGHTLLQMLDGLFVMDDFETNGMFLPSTVNDAAESGLALHFLDHPDYRAFTQKVMTDIYNEHMFVNGEEIGSSHPEYTARRTAAYNDLLKLQDYLREGLIARPAGDWAEGDPMRPRFFLNYDDPGWNGDWGFGDLNTAYQHVMSSQVVTDLDYRNRVATALSIDLNGHEAYDLRMALSRAGVIDPDFADHLYASGFHSFGRFVKHTGGAVDTFDALLMGIVGLAYVKTGLNEGQTLEQIAQGIYEKVDAELLASTATSVVAGVAVFGAVSALTGPVGVATLILLSSPMMFEDLKKAVTDLHEAFPEWEFLETVVDILETVEPYVAGAMNAVTGFLEALMPRITMASGEMIVNGDSSVDLMLGFEQSVLNGGDGNDWMVHFGSGELKGGAGNDKLFGIGADYGGPGDVLEIRGEAGDDILGAVGGAGAYMYGGVGEDILLAFGSGENHLYGKDGPVEGGSTTKDGDTDTFVTGGGTTFIHDADGDDQVSFAGIPIYGGVQQWWMEEGVAAWSPFSSIASAFPATMIGAICSSR